MTQGWREYFDASASALNHTESEKLTAAEVDFIVKELQLRSGAAILDVGCGMGRHSIELARRGYKVTGIDFSTRMIEQARQKSETAGVEVTWINVAAQDYSAEDEFDAAFSIFSGALCLFEEGDSIWGKDMAILANISSALKTEGKFLFTVLNAFSAVRSLSDEKVASGGLDLFTLSCPVDRKCVVDGRETYFKGLMRYYTPSEFVRMVNRIGLKADSVFGGTAGKWRGSPLLLDEQEFMITGHRKAKSK